MFLHVLGHVEAESVCGGRQNKKTGKLFGKLGLTHASRAQEKGKRPIGRLGFFKPVRLRRIARLTAEIAAAWPIT